MVKNNQTLKQIDNSQFREVELWYKLKEGKPMHSYL